METIDLKVKSEEALAAASVPGLEPEKRKQKLDEFKLLRDVYDREIELNNRAVQIEQKMDELDAEIEKAKIDADAKKSESKLRLVGEVIKAVGQTAGVIVGGVVTLTGYEIVTGAEADGKLILSKVWGLIPKIFKS